MNSSNRAVFSRENFDDTGLSQKTCPAFARLLLPGYMSSDILQYLIE